VVDLSGGKLAAKEYRARISQLKDALEEIRDYNWLTSKTHMLPKEKMQDIAQKALKGDSK
ncbi:hypothetical protein LCGC14_2836260, partial [marine sediment metagenome]